MNTILTTLLMSLSVFAAVGAGAGKGSGDGIGSTSPSKEPSAHSRKAPCYTGSAIGCLFESQVGVNYAPVTIHNPDHMSDFGNAVSPYDEADEVTVTLRCPFPLNRDGSRDCFVTEFHK